MTGFIDPLAGDASQTPPTDDEVLGQVRDLVLRAHPNVVPELVTGANLADLLASIEPATTAYEALATRFSASHHTPESIQVPAGTVPPGVVDPDTLSPVEKVRRGLAEMTTRK